MTFPLPSLLLLLALALPAQSAPVARTAPPAALPLQFGYRDGAETIRIAVDGDALAVTSNDQPLAPERLRRQGSRVLLYGPHYELTAQLTLWSGGGSLQTFADKRPMVVGFRLQVPSPDEVKGMGIDAMNVRKVLSVTPGLPAAKAGIVAGDVLLQIEGDPVVTETRLRSLLLQKKPGDKMRFLLSRGEAKVPCSITLEPATAAAGFYELDGAAARTYVQGLRALGGDNEVLEFAGSLGMPRAKAPAAPPPVVHVDGKRMLVMTPGGAAASSSSSSGTAAGDEPRLELQRLQQRLDEMERMLQKLIELREKGAAKDDKSK